MLYLFVLKFHVLSLVVIKNIKVQIFTHFIRRSGTYSQRAFFNSISITYIYIYILHIIYYIIYYIILYIYIGYRIYINIEYVLKEIQYGNRFPLRIQ